MSTVRVLRNNITRRAGAAAVELVGLQVLGNVSVVDLGRAATPPECRNEYGDAVCQYHIRVRGLQCDALFCPKCNYAHRCDKLCGVCAEQQLPAAAAATTDVRLARLGVGEAVEIRGVEFHEAVAVHARAVTAAHFIVGPLLPPPEAVGAPDGTNSSLAFFGDLAVNRLLRLSLAGLSLQVLTVADVTASESADVELDFRGAAVAADLVVHNVTSTRLAR